MTNPVLPVALSALTPQIPLDAGIAAVSANRATYFNETVQMVVELNTELPKTHQNAVAAKEAADDAEAAKNAAELARIGAVDAAGLAEMAAGRAEQAAAGVENPVSRDDKATATDLANGAANKWLDAQVAKAALDDKQPAGSYATEQQFSDLSARVDSSATIDTQQTLNNKTLQNAKEVQTNWGTANSINPLTVSNATVRPTGNISFSVAASTSAADVGKSAIVAITPSAAVTFVANAAVKWPGNGVAPNLVAGRTYLLSLANMQVGSSYFWLANLAGPY